jgi:hypothetical protein
MGGSHALPSSRFQACKKDVPRHHLPSVWHPENCDKRWMVTFHRSKVPKVLMRSQCESQGSHTISSRNKWASRNFEQTNQEHTIKTVNEIGMVWKDKLSDAVWAYRTAYKPLSG